MSPNGLPRRLRRDRASSVGKPPISLEPTPQSQPSPSMILMAEEGAEMLCVCSGEDPDMESTLLGINELEVAE
jgi:hypothetical protein